MKILVPVKRAVDKDVKIRVKADGTGVELVNVESRLRLHYDNSFRLEGISNRRNSRRSCHGISV